MKKIKDVSFLEFITECTEYARSLFDIKHEYQFEALYRFIKSENDNIRFNPKYIMGCVCECFCPNGLPDVKCCKHKGIESLHKYYYALELGHGCILINRILIKKLNKNK